MVGHKLVETLVQRGATAEWDVHVFGEEPRHAYDRVGLSSLFDGATADDLLGLEAANALRLLELETHVVEFAPRLMPVQIDDGGGAVLRERIEQRGVSVHTGMQTTEVLVGDDNGVTGLRFAADDAADLS